MGIAYNTSIVRDGLVLHLDAANVKSYPGSGTEWNDLSGNGYNGTLTNGPLYSADNNGYIAFDGSNDTVLMNSSSSYGTGAMTVEVWCNSNTNADSIITRGASRDSTSTRELDFFGNGSNLTFFITNKANRNTVNTPFPSLNVWHQIVGTWDGTTNSNGMRIYIDGQLASADNATSDITSTTETFDLYVGGNPSRPYVFNGEIANTMFYNRALTPSEIQKNFEALRGRYGI